MESLTLSLQTSVRPRSSWLGIGFITLALSVTSFTAPALARFTDTNDHWAQAYIAALASQGVINGFPDGSFRPNQAVTRAQFATIVTNTLRLPPTTGAIRFFDVPANYWANGAINSAASNSLVSGFPDGSFRPEQPVTRTQTWVVLANTLDRRRIPVAQTTDLFNRYRDAASVPPWALDQVALASQGGVIVNYPDPTLLEPNRSATRAEVAAFTYQALTQRVTQDSFPPQPLSTPGFALQVVAVPAGTLIQVTSTANERLFIAPNETRPYSLIVQTPVRNTQGEIVVPYGSRVDGRFEPALGGTHFVSESIIINNQVFPLTAQTDVIPDMKDPRQVNSGQVLQDAAIGAAAGAILGAVTGDRVVATEEVLGAGIAGAAIGNVTAPRISQIDPQHPLNLRLTQDLTTSR